MIRALSLATLVLSAAGCATATMDRVMQSWQGEHIDVVVKQWGYPHEQMDFRGRQLYVWNKNEIVSAPAFTTSTTNASGRISAAPGAIVASGKQTTTAATFGGGSQSFTCRRVLEVDTAGIVTDGKWDGNGCCFATAAGYCATLPNPARP